MLRNTQRVTLSVLLLLFYTNLCYSQKLQVWDWSKLSLPSKQHAGKIGDEIKIDVEHMPNSFSIVGNQLRVYLNPTDPAPVGESTNYNFRAEIRDTPWRIDHPLGTEQWMGWSYTFASDYKIDPTQPNALYQNHPGVVGYSPSIRIELAGKDNPKPASGGEIAIINQTSGIINPCNPVPGGGCQGYDRVVTDIKPKPGDRIDIVMQIIYGRNDNGRLRIWMNGKLYYNKYISTVYHDLEHGGNSKWGFYNHKWRNKKDVESSLAIGITKREMYIGTIKILTRRPGDPGYGSDAYDIVKPTGGTLPTKPQIINQPEHLNIEEGQGANFSIDATGQGLSYQWQKDGSDISGATSSSYIVADADLADAGNYRVIVSNSSGSATSNAATLTVNPIIPPSVTTQPSDVNVDEGDNATFTVSVSGTGPFNFQWQKDGTDITRADSDTYTVSNADLGDEGDYQVIITNSKGNATSNAATLTINKLPPSITSQPSNDTILEGGDATFSVSATGTGSLSYQWQKDGSDISGATSSSYTVSNAALSDAGDYQVVITNAAGSETSNAATLTVNPIIPPSVTTQPLDVNVDEGDNATFTVSVSGTGPFNFQWQKDGTDITRADSDTYTISNADLGDEGDYQVIITNSKGNVTSNAATLTINKLPPSITSQPSNDTILEGGDATFSVSATGTGSLSYQWQKDGSDISGATSSSYTVSNAALSDAGDYQVVITNAAGSETSNAATLTVNPIIPPSVTTQPLDVNVDEGDNATFTVSVSGTGPFNFQWQKDGTDITGADSDTYTVSNADLGDEGDYQVIITNSKGNATSNAATLTINKLPPSITSQPSNDTILEGGDATFSVSATGTGSLSYQWQKDGSDISGATSSSYTVSNAALSDAGDYQVVITNAAGSETSNAATLTVNPIIPPSVTTQPLDVNVDEGDNATFTVSVSGTGPFNFQWQKDGTDITRADSDTYTISNADLGDEGDYQVIITNSKGNVTSNAATLTINKLPPSITSQPSNDTILEGGDATFSVSATGTGSLSYQWQKDGSDISGATSSSYTVSNAALSDAGDYQVVITNAAGSETSNAATLTVNPIIPPSVTTQPLDVNVDEGDNATFTVSVSGTGPFNFQWQKDGTDITGADSDTYTIANAVLSDEGDYQVIITNSKGNVTSNAASLSLNQLPPVVTTQPVDITTTEGDQVTFTVTASGSGSISYQWQKDGNNITGATTNTYSINSTTTADAGAYLVVVTNGGGSSTSNSAVLTVNPVAPPSIFSQPNDLTVDDGSQASFVVVANGTDPISYQWQKDGSDISGATESTLIVADASFADEGSYHVIVSNRAGTISSQSADLTVNPIAPSITNQPKNIDVIEGTSASFSVSATGSGTISYQWQKDGTDIPGANATDYTVSNVSQNDSGNYQVVLTNLAGSITSEVAVLTVSQVAQAPVINGQPADLSVTEGESANFTVAVTGTAPFNFQWQKDGNDIAGANSDTYSISSATLNDDGDYGVTVSNSAGSVMSNVASLSVNQINTDVPVVITSQPLDLTVDEGNPAGFSVVATGTGPITYQWLKDGQNISGANSSSFDISSATLSDVGDYSVRVTNSMGSETSTVVRLMVMTVPPLAVTAEIDPSICTANDGSITLTITGGVEPYQVSWSQGVFAREINGLSPGNYEVTVTDAAGDKVVEKYTVDLVIIEPEVTLAITHASCLNNDGVLSLSGPASSNYQYDWDHGVTGPELTGLEAGDYFVTVTSGTGCQKRFRYTVNSTLGPAKPSIEQVQDSLYINSSASSYQWYSNGTMIPGANNQYLKIEQSGTYSVAITNDLGCSVSSDEYQASYVALSSQTASSSNILDVDMYPIPARNNLNLRLQLEQPTSVQIEIFDIRGSSKMSEEHNLVQSSFSTGIDVTDYRRGIYVMKIRAGDETVTRRFIKI